MEKSCKDNNIDVNQQLLSPGASPTGSSSSSLSSSSSSSPGAGVVLSSTSTTTTSTSATTCTNPSTTASKKEEEEKQTNNETNNTIHITKKNDEFPKAGVKFSYVIGEFLTQVIGGGGRNHLQGWTTARVFQEIIKPKTKSHQSSYCDMLKEQGHPAYGETAQIFISHAHSFGILDFLSALEWKFQKSNIPMDTIVWMDLFSINQHLPLDWTFDWLSTTFKSAVQVMGRTIMVMSPWDHPVPFTRSWCVFEAYCTAVTKSQFDIAMTKQDEMAFMEQVKKDPEGQIEKMVLTIRADKSLCSVESDRDAIFAVIRSTVGFSKLDAMVFERYREWVIQASLEALESCSNTQEISEYLYSIGALYASQGNYYRAEKCFKECMNVSGSILGSNHPEVLRLSNLLGRVLMEQGKYDETERLFERSLSQTNILFGDEHPDTLCAINDMATICCNQQNYEKAHELYQACFEKQKSILGLDHPDTLRTMNSLATVKFNQGNYKDAQILYETSLEKRIELLGENHPDTLYSMNDLATVLLWKGDGDGEGEGEEELLEKAQQMFQTCLQRRKVVLGEDHIDTLRSMNDLAVTFFKQEKYGAAELLYKWCFEGRKSVLGDDHPDTILVREDLESIHELRTKKVQQQQQRRPHVGKDFVDSFVVKYPILGQFWRVIRSW